MKARVKKASFARLSSPDFSGLEALFPYMAHLYFLKVMREQLV